MSICENPKILKILIDQLDRAELAQYLNVSQPTISLWLTGKRNMNFDQCKNFIRFVVEKNPDLFVSVLYQNDSNDILQKYVSMQFDVMELRKKFSYPQEYHDFSWGDPYDIIERALKMVETAIDLKKVLLRPDINEYMPQKQEEEVTETQTTVKEVDD
ncbi:putative transcriptional regulator [Sulfolobales Beppu virus 1]|nr:putative transcriptional regulator [Sulfolobales Beppu virus 1]